VAPATAGGRRRNSEISSRDGQKKRSAAVSRNPKHMTMATSRSPKEATCLLWEGDAEWGQVLQGYSCCWSTTAVAGPAPGLSKVTVVDLQVLLDAAIRETHRRVVTDVAAPVSYWHRPWPAVRLLAQRQTSR
jgi:hypothetical protein